MRRRQIVALLVFGLLLFILIDAGQQTSAPSFFRLHILAHSDSADDQKMKLEIRDLVLQELALPLAAADSTEAAARETRKNMAGIEKKIAAVLCENGLGYGVTGEIAAEDFPETKYSGYNLPAGRYLALRIVLGEGKGKNWWCVLYPPLCYTGLTQQSEVVDVMSGTDYRKKTSLIESLKKKCSRELRKILISQ